MITSSLVAMALVTSLTPALPMEVPPGNPGSQFKVMYRSSPENPWACYDTYDSHAEAVTSAQQLASTGHWEVQVVEVGKVVNPGNHFKLLYRSSPENPWAVYDCYTNYADAATAAQQLSFTGHWEVQIVGY